MDPLNSNFEIYFDSKRAQTTTVADHELRTVDGGPSDRSAVFDTSLNSQHLSDYRAVSATRAMSHRSAASDVAEYWLTAPF